MDKKESNELLNRKWPSLSTLKSYFEKEGVEVLYFDGVSLETKIYRYTLVSPQLYMEKL